MICSCISVCSHLNSSSIAASSLYNPYPCKTASMTSNQHRRLVRQCQKSPNSCGLLSYTNTQNPAVCIPTTQCSSREPKRHPIRQFIPGSIHSPPSPSQADDRSRRRANMQLALLPLYQVPFILLQQDSQYCIPPSKQVVSQHLGKGITHHLPILISSIHHRGHWRHACDRCVHVLPILTLGVHMVQSP